MILRSRIASQKQEIQINIINATFSMGGPVVFYIYGCRRVTFCSRKYNNMKHVNNAIFPLN